MNDDDDIAWAHSMGFGVRPSQPARPVMFERLAFGYRVGFVDFNEWHVVMAHDEQDARQQAARILGTILLRLGVHAQVVPPPTPGLEAATYLTPAGDED